MNRRPNILWYCSDQQRFDTIGALGNPHVHTPHLDRLVERGVAFTHAYCQSPICTPSRASFLTGMYPSRVHVNYNHNDRFPAESERWLVTRRLADAGYDCGLVGKLHLSSMMERRERRPDDGYRFFRWSHHPGDDWPPGWHDYADTLRAAGHDSARLLEPHPVDWYRLSEPTAERDNIPPELHQTTWCTTEGIDFVRQHQGTDTPWLLSVNPFDPHPSFDPPYEYYRRFDPSSLPGPHFQPTDLEHQRHLSGVYFQTDAHDPSTYPAREMQAAYYAMIELIDDQLGRLLAAIEESGQTDDTVVIFTSDHGEALGDHGLVQKGCRFYEGLTRVPLIWSWPGRLGAGVQSDALVELTDIAPTLLELAGEPVPEEMQGRSLMPMLGQAEAAVGPHRDYVRCEFLNALWQDPYRPHPTRPNPAAHATMFRDDRWKLVVYHSHGLGELYDLQEDPLEFHSLWDDPGHATIRAELMQRSFDATVMAADPGPDVAPEARL